MRAKLQRGQHNACVGINRWTSIKSKFNLPISALGREIIHLNLYYIIGSYHITIYRKKSIRNIYIGKYRNTFN